MTSDHGRHVVGMLWLTAIPISVIGIFMVIAVMLDLLQGRGIAAVELSISLTVLSAGILHVSVAMGIKRDAMWAANASIVLCIGWLLIFGAATVLLLISAMALTLISSPFLLFAASCLHSAIHFRREIRDDDGWSRDGPLRDAKGFQVLRPMRSEARDEA